QRVVHLPKFSLETGGFRSERRFTSVFVGWERKISKNNAQPRIIFLQQFLSEPSELSARRALEIAELLQGDRSLRIAANMRRSSASLRDTLTIGNILNLRTLCAIKHRATAKGGQCDDNDNYKRQVSFHAREKRRISARQFLRQVRAELRFAFCFGTL